MDNTSGQEKEMTKVKQLWPASLQFMGQKILKVDKVKLAEYAHENLKSDILASVKLKG